MSPICRPGQPCRSGFPVLATIPLMSAEIVRLIKAMLRLLCGFVERNQMGNSMPPGIKFISLAFASLAICLSAAKAEEGQTIAGADFCADQFILAFADPRRIVGVSNDAISPHSFFRGRAQGLHKLRGGVEEILTLQPALLVRSWGGGAAVDALFSRVGITAYQPPYAVDYKASLANFQAVADLLGEGEKGRAFVADHQARFEALQNAPEVPLKAVYLTPSGYSAGAGTSVDTVIRLAGLSPIAEDVGLVGWGVLPLEKLVMQQPEIVIGSFFDDEAVHVSHWSSGRHSVFKGLVEALPAIMVPSALMSCGGAFSVEAAEYIRAELARLDLLPVSNTPFVAMRKGEQ